jgi:hypothetical protein
LLSALLSAIARGRWDVLRGFLTTAKRVASEQRERAHRQRLLQIARAELAKAPVAAEPSALAPFAQ